MAWPRTCANAASVATAALAAGGIALAVLAPTPAVLGILAVGLLVAPTSAALGVVVARRQPRNVVGMLLALVGATEAFTATKEIGWQVLAGRPDLRTGSGLADRVAALGGQLKVDSPAGSGTVVEAVLPCAS